MFKVDLHLAYKKPINVNNNTAFISVNKFPINNDNNKTKYLIVRQNQHVVNRLYIAYMGKAYRKTGIRDPSGTLAGPNKNRKIGILAGPYKNRKTRIRDLSGTLKKPGIIYNSISFKICKVNVNEM